MTLEKDFPPMTGDGPVTQRTRLSIISGTIPIKDAKKVLAEARHQDWKDSKKSTEQT